MGPGDGGRSDTAAATSEEPEDGSGIELRVTPRMRDIPAAAWNALVGPLDSPFVRHEWLVSLEDAGCVTPELGWLPQHITVWKNGQLKAAAPAYVKGNYEGEFVFDHAWHRVADRIGIEYYPKLIVAVPFTPATGRRLLAGSGEDAPLYRSLLAEGVRAVVDKLELSSGHVLFPLAEESEALADDAFVPRLGVQFHWKNEGYRTYEDFLGSMNAKRRHQLKRERREVLATGLTVRTLRGKEITEEALDAMVGFYAGTCERFRPWTRQYVNHEFFRLVVERMGDAIEIVQARDGERIIAGAFNVSGSERLYGRYWGASEERPFLHFHVCYYHSVEDCIARGIQVFEPGAGGEHKVPRGFVPTVTHSAHHIRDKRLRAIVQDHLMRERAAIREHVEAGE
jgi:uncharacterized protein